MGAGSVPVDVLFLACTGTKGADAVLGVGDTGIFGTGAVHGRWGWRLRREEQLDLSLKRDRSRGQEQPAPGSSCLQPVSPGNFHRRSGD